MHGNSAEDCSQIPRSARNDVAVGAAPASVYILWEIEEWLSVN